MNQIEAHPLLPQDDLVKYCNEKGINITAYKPLGSNGKRYEQGYTHIFDFIDTAAGKPMLTDHPVVLEIAKKLNATSAQVLIAWGVYRGYSVIPKSVQKERIVSNFKQIQLDEEDYNKLSALGREYTR